MSNQKLIPQRIGYGGPFRDHPVRITYRINGQKKVLQGRAMIYDYRYWSNEGVDDDGILKYIEAAGRNWPTPVQTDGVGAQIMQHVARCGWTTWREIRLVFIEKINWEGV